MSTSRRRRSCSPHRVRPLVMLAWVLIMFGCRWVQHRVATFACGWIDPEPTPAEKEAKERLSRRLAVEGLERRLLTTRECDGCSLRYAELAGADLRNTRFKGGGINGNMRSADFRGADLTGTSFSGDLSRADFRGADLTGTTFSGDLSRADFRGAVVKNIGFSGATLKGARFDGLNLRGLVNAEAADWSGAILRDANLEGVGFHGLYGGFRRTTSQHPLDPGAGGTHLNHADLRGANLRWAVLVKSDLRGADLRGADLRSAVMPYPEDLQNAELSGAIWTDGRRCAEGSTGYCIAEGGATIRQRRRNWN